MSTIVDITPRARARGGEELRRMFLTLRVCDLLEFLFYRLVVDYGRCNFLLVFTLSRGGDDVRAAGYAQGLRTQLAVSPLFARFRRRWRVVRTLKWRQGSTGEHGFTLYVRKKEAGG